MKMDSQGHRDQKEERGGDTMNRDEGQYHLSHVFDDLLSPKEKSLGDKRTGNSKTTKAVVVSRH